MKPVLVIARKEFRSYFESSIALIFLAIFLLATLFSFFGYSAFFARNLADIRPLFAWLPLLLIFLVAAITMRQWAEERKMGTLEILLTLPVRTRDLVLGKFLAGSALVGLALLMTLPIPLMVSQLGDLDWGPVVGGYVGALLLGATYLSIGLCVSARTDNQVVSLMLTGVVASLLYFVGSDSLTQLFGNRIAELLRALGTGSRFASIERGVLDLRDLAYYAGLAAFFLTLNGHFLEAERLDPGSAHGESRRRGLLLRVLLVGLNVLALDVWLAPVTAARVDLTERGEYSISPATREILSQLDEPLFLSGYFSERTHPLLAPLVPQLRDLLEEYSIQGGSKVRVQFADPNADEALEQEIGERYGIRSVPFRVADRHQQAVVNSYFHVLVRYGDQYQVLSFDDLIDVRFDDENIEVRLKNPEYDLTRAIKRVSQQFQNMESLFARFKEPAILTAYWTLDSLPEEFKVLPERVRKIAHELEQNSAGKLQFAEVDPSKGQQTAQELQDKYGIRPLAVDLFGRRTFYFDLIFESKDKAQRISPRTDLPEAELRRALEAAVRRATPGQLKIVGLVTEKPVAPPPNPRIPPQFQPPPPRADYRTLEHLFGEDYEVKRLELRDGVVPDEIDVLLVGKPGNLDEKQQFAIDQYLMRGGKLIALAGRYSVTADRSGLRASKQPDPLFDMLAQWGVEVKPALLMDPQNAPFPIPVQERHGMFSVQRIRMLPYPFFPDVRQDGFEAGQPALVGLQNVTLPWASPLEVTPREGVDAQTFVQSSAGAWLNETGSIEPDFQNHPKTGFGPAGEQGRYPLVVALSGRFPSTFAKRPSPLFKAKESNDDDQADAEDPAVASTAGGKGDATGRTMKQSLPDAKLVVIGSAEIVSDLTMELANQLGGEEHRANGQLVQNLTDWCAEDTDLLSIRSPGLFARTLRPLEPGEARFWEGGSYAATACLLLAVTWLPRRARRHMVALPVGEEQREGAPS